MRLSPRSCVLLQTFCRPISLHYAVITSEVDVRPGLVADKSPDAHHTALLLTLFAP